MYEKLSRAENRKLQAAILSKMGKELEVTSRKLQQNNEPVSKRIIGVEERVSHLEKTLETKNS